MVSLLRHAIDIFISDTATNFLIFKPQADRNSARMKP
jgi:hypothetical protein